MIAVLTPSNLEARIVPLKAVEFSAQAGVGYLDATVNIGRVSGSVFARLLYADVVLWGRLGPVWRGVVESADRDGTLHLVGPHNILGWHRAPAATYTSTAWGYLNTVTGTGIIPTWLMPNDARYRAYMTDDGVSLGSVVYPEESQAERISNGLRYTNYEYGWYFDYVQGVGQACVPHFAAPPTTPAYVIHVSPEDAEALAGTGLEGMADNVRVDYGTGTQDVADTDPTHYLVTTARSRWQALKPSACTTSANATLVGGAYLAVNAHPVSGSVSTSTIQRASGTTAYLPAIRPGNLARVVGLPSGPTTLRIHEVTCTGEHVATIGVGQSSRRLDTLLAKFGG